MAGARTSRQHAQGAQVEFVAVTVLAVEGARAPPLLQTGNVRELIGHPRREDEPPGFKGFTAGRDLKAVPYPRGLGSPSVQPFHRRVGQHLSFALGLDGGGRLPILSQEAVGMTRESVPPLPGVDDEDRPTRPRQLKRCCEAGIAATDDDDVVHDPISSAPAHRLFREAEPTDRNFNPPLYPP